MNPIFRDLLGMAPGLITGLRDPQAGSALMAGWERARKEHEARTRQQQQDTLAGEDRQWRIDRQKAEDARAAEDQTWQNTQRNLGVAQSLNQAGATADSLQGAESAIDTLFRVLPPHMQEQMAPVRDASIRGAGAQVTSRQRAELRRWVTDTLQNSKLIQGAEDADPEVTQAMPPRIRQIAEALTGQTAFKKSDVFRVAEALEQAKPPSAEVSLQSKEVFVNGKPVMANYNPKTGKYSDQDGNPITVDPVPPKPTGGSDGRLNPYQEAQFTERLAKTWNDANSSGREMRRQLGLMETGLRRFKEGDKNGGSQAVLVTFQKILDPTSVVRESEYARSAHGISMLSRMEGYMERLKSGGAGVPEAELAQMVETARQMLAGMQGHAKTQRSRIEAQATKYQIDPVLIFGMEEPETSTTVPDPTTPPARPGTNPPKKNPFRP